MEDLFHALVGRDPDTITWWQMAVRGAIVFLYSVTLVRLGGARIFGRNTSLDIVLAVLLGSSLSRALTANAPFVPTLAATAALVGLHMLMAALTRRSRRLGHLVKGEEVKLVEDGAIRWEAMAKAQLTEHELMEGLRLRGGTDDLGRVAAAYLERNGQISVIRRREEE